MYDFSFVLLHTHTLMQFYCECYLHVRVSGTPGMCVDAVRQVGLEPYTAVLNGSRQWL